MALDVNRIVTKCLAEKRLVIPPTDELYVIGAMLDALVTDGFERSGIAKLADELKRSNTQARLDRTEIAADVRRLQNELGDLRRALEAVQEEIAKPLTLAEPLPSEKGGWFKSF